MRRPHLLSFLLLPLLVGLALPSCSGGEADKALAPFQGEGFSVRMPGSPKRSTETAQSAAGPLTLVLYTSESKNKAYTVGYTDLPGGIQADLSQVIKGAAGAVKGTATDEADTTYQGLPARDSRITNASDGKGNTATVFMRAIKADTRLYQLQYLEEGGDVKAAPAAYTEFLSSLKIG